MLKIFHPKLFQGSLKKKNYFEGWYFKHVSADNRHVISVIPGISLNKKDSHSFIQVIDGVTGFTRYFTYPLESFSAEDDYFKVTVGNSVFSEKEIILSLRDKDVKISGSLHYNDLKAYPSSFFSPGVMGWYTFVPFMECYHGVVSVNHRIEGSLKWNSDLLSFDSGKGYIEKDWGKSFPQSWIWLQCNSFSEDDASLMVSVAKIPWLGKFFIGFISFLYYKGTFYLFNTHNNSQIQSLVIDDKSTSIVVSNKDMILEIKAHSEKSGILAAPDQGAMTRRIKESVDARVEFVLKDINGTEIIHDHGQRAGLEIIESLLKYFT